MKKNDLSEFEMEKEGFKIKLRRPSGEGKSDEVQVQHYLPPVAPAPAEVPAAYLSPHQSFTAKAVGAEMAAHRVIQAFLQPEPPVRLPPAAR